MAKSIDVRGTFELCTTDKVHTVWWAEIDGRIFMNRSGHCFFYRKADLINSLKQSPVREVVYQFARNYINFHKGPTQEICTVEEWKKIFDVFWKNIVGETEEHRVKLRHCEIPVTISNPDLLRLYGEEIEKAKE